MRPQQWTGPNTLKSCHSRKCSTSTWPWNASTGTPGLQFPDTGWLPWKRKAGPNHAILDQISCHPEKDGAFRLKCRQDFPPVSSQYKRTLYCLYTYVHTYVLHHSHFLSHCHTHFIPSSFHFTIVRTADLAMCPPPHTHRHYTYRNHTQRLLLPPKTCSQSLPSGQQQRQRESILPLSASVV